MRAEMSVARLRGPQQRLNLGQRMLALDEAGERHGQQAFPVEATMCEVSSSSTTRLGDMAGPRAGGVAGATEKFSRAALARAAFVWLYDVVDVRTRLA